MIKTGIAIFILISLFFDMIMYTRSKKEYGYMKQTGVSFPSEKYELHIIFLLLPSIISLFSWILLLLISISFFIEYSPLKEKYLYISIIGIFIMIFSRINRGIYGYYNQFGSKITSTGLYKYIRHPQYLGYLLIYFGLWLYFQIIYLWILIPVIYIIYNKIANEEERLLTLEFGQAYSQYKISTVKYLFH